MAMVVDCHMHILEPDWNPMNVSDGMSDSWARQVRWFEPPQSDTDYFVRAWEASSDGNGDKAVARMDEAGVDVSVMMPMDHGVTLGEEGVIPIAEKNRLCAEARQTPPRPALHVLRGRPAPTRRPRDPDHRSRRLGSDRVEAVPHQRVLPRRRGRGVPAVPVPTGAGPAGPGTPGPLGGTAQVQVRGTPSTSIPPPPDFPELRFVLGHSARYETWAHEAISVAIYKTNVHLDMSLWQHWISPDELVRKLVWMRDRIGPDRILFGSDMAGIEVSLTLKQWVDQFRMAPEWAKQLGYRLPQHHIDLILGENTRRIYRIDDHTTV